MVGWKSSKQTVEWQGQLEQDEAESPGRDWNSNETAQDSMQDGPSEYLYENEMFDRAMNG